MFLQTKILQKDLQDCHMWSNYKINSALLKSSRRLALYRETELSDYIEILHIGNLRREGTFMSDFELLSIILMMLSIIVSILIAYINQTKK